MNNKDLFSELEQRGFIYQSSDEHLPEKLNKDKMTVYVGTDPTADSLHVGHLVPLMMMSHFQKHGHKPIVLVGGATGMIGDPSFKSKERQLLSIEIIEQNLKKIKQQIENIVMSGEENSLQLVNNFDWFKKMNILEFLRETGKCFSVNNMLSKESVKKRLESGDEGMSFTEFSYTLLQAYDFLYLYQQHGCNLQIGGSDQWGNIISGIDLVRKKTGGSVYGLTCPLITKEDGTKFGKTESGNVWLDPMKTTPYQFYQFWINAPDKESLRYIKLYTFLPLEEISHIEERTLQEPEKRLVQRILAYEVTKLIHGEHTAKKVQHVSAILFGETIQSLDDESIKILEKEIPTTHIFREEINTMTLHELLIKTGLVKSKNEARKLIEARGIYINNVPVSPYEQWENKDAFLLRKGKKEYRLVLVEENPQKN
jgi:tyrosyl-tRNA synthetase